MLQLVMCGRIVMGQAEKKIPLLLIAQWNLKKNFTQKKFMKYVQTTVQKNAKRKPIRFQLNSLEKRMYFYFKSLSYTSISQEPVMNKIDLVAEAGGILGLFLGKFSKLYY